MKVFLFFLFFSVPALALETQIRFDHGMHLDKVFKPNSISCNHCHNFEADPGSRKIRFNENTRNSILKNSRKQICHECHQSSLPKYSAAPKSCLTCHRGIDSLAKVKPFSHESTFWKSGHSSEARVKGESCTNRHVPSQCTKCHLQRQDVEQANHPRNFRFYHSVQARSQPQRCDACHTKSFCVNCHMGKK